MKTFTNLFGTVITHKPIFHTAVGVWRVARFEDDVFNIMFENKGFKTEETCQECIDNSSKNQFDFMLDNYLIG